MRFLLSLLNNAVPAFGIFVREWAAPSALLLYLGENIVLVLLGALTMILLIPRSDARKKSLQTFFLVAVPFKFGAAVFTAAVFIIRDEYPVNARELGAGFAAMAVFQVIAFGISLRKLRGIELGEMENLLSGVLGRVFLLAFGVWLGLLLAFFVTTAFVIPFIVLKTIVDLGSIRRRTPSSPSA